MSFADHAAPYTSDMGVRRVMGDKYKYKDDTYTYYYYAMCETHKGQCSGNWALKEYQLDAQWGVVPWGTTKVVDPNAAPAE